MMLPAVTLLTQSMGFARAEESAKRWSVYTSDHYQLFNKPEHEKDAKKVKGFLDTGIASLKKEFNGFPVDDLLRVNCDIYLHPEATSKASESRSTINSWTDNQGKYFAVIDLLAPSAYNPNYRSNVNEPPGDDHFFKLVMHEYSPILLDRITQAKKTGWLFYSAPRWFTDGYEEYLGLMLSSPRNRTEVLAKYLTIHKDDPDRIDFDFGVSVKDDYIDGTLLLLFMHETFGKDRIHAVLRSEERRFGKAIVSALNVDLDEFEKRWEEWLNNKLE
jgi:hypothetical protein